MFRMFLVKQVASASGPLGKAKATTRMPPQRLRNRRIYDRFDIDHKHLALLNDQDILLVRDLSEKGFSTEVSDRGFRRMSVGDVYLCRIRYLAEVYDANVSVRWKAKRFIGFEIVKHTKALKTFMERLLIPLEVGTSLKPVPEKENRANDNGMMWYHGTYETNFYLWEDDAGEVASWQLEDANRFVRWDSQGGLVTGKVQAKDHNSLLFPWQQSLVADDNINENLRQYATDIFMALALPQKQQLINSLLES